jgi:hypothetical protein
MTRIPFAALALTAAIPALASADAHAPRYRMPCAPETGYSWCMAPNRDAAVRDMPASAKRMIAREIKKLVLETAAFLESQGREAGSSAIRAEGKAIAAAVRGVSGESLFLSLVPRDSRPTVDIVSDDMLAHTFALSLSGAAGKRKPFMGKRLLDDLARRDVYCTGPELILYTDRAGNPRYTSNELGCTID